MNEAIGKIRAALKGHDLLGAEAIDLKPGAVVLVVLRPPATASPSDIEAVGRTWGAMAEMLQAEGVRAVACCVPHGFALDVIEVAGEAPPDDRSVVGADGREIARLRPLPTAPAVTSTIEAEAERWRKAGIAAHAAGDLGAQAIAMARCDSLTGAVRAVRGQACFGVVPVLTSPPPSPSEVEAVTRRADAAAQAFVAHVATPPPPGEPFPWDAPAEGYGVATVKSAPPRAAPGEFEFGAEQAPAIGFALPWSRIGAVPDGVEFVYHDENKPDPVKP